MLKNHNYKLRINTDQTNDLAIPYARNCTLSHYRDDSNRKTVLPMGV